MSLDKNPQTMQELAEEVGTSLMPLKEKTLIEVIILSKTRNRILVDVQGITQGIISEKEFSSDIGELKPGDKVLAYILCVENDNGFAVLSLKKADKERFTANINQKFKEQETVTVRIKQANRGGLIVEYGNLEGFLPASQLASSHYPKVGDNKDRIIGKLNELVGKSLKVKIINFDEPNNKLIFSEKAAGDSILEEKIGSLQIGQELDGEISGVVDFGVFVDIGGLEGLVHISEISWDKVENIRNLFHLGDKVKVKVLSLENGKVYFSIKRLTTDPWLELVKDLKPGQVVKGKVSKITPFGAFVDLEGNIKGLIHISELTDEMKKSASGKLEDVLNFGKEYDFTIKEIENDNHKINLTMYKPKSTERKTDKAVKKDKDKVVKKKTKTIAKKTHKK